MWWQRELPNDEGNGNTRYVALVSTVAVNGNEYPLSNAIDGIKKVG